MPVSVIIPAYDAVEFLPQAIASVLAQSWPASEVIVVNDGSPRTAELESAIALFRQSVSYIWQPNGGPGAARNTGLAAAREEFVAFLDADDYWDGDFLARQLALFGDDPRLDLAYCDGWICGDTPLAGRRFMELSPSTGTVTVGSLLTCACTVITSGVVARAATIRAVGGFDASLRRGQDFDLWLRLAWSGARIDYQTIPLVHRRVHAGNPSGNAVAGHQRVINVLSKPCWRDLPAGDRALLERRASFHHRALALEHGKAALAEGRFGDARAHLADAAAGRSDGKLWAVRLALSVMPRVLQLAVRRKVVRRTSPAAGTTNTPIVQSAQPPPTAATHIAAELPRTG